MRVNIPVQSEIVTNKIGSDSNEDAIASMTSSLIQWRTSTIHDRQDQLHKSIIQFEQSISSIDLNDYPIHDVSQLYSEMDELITKCREFLNQKKVTTPSKSLLVDCTHLLCILLQLISLQSFYPIIITEERLLLIVRYLKDISVIDALSTKQLCTSLITILKSHYFSQAAISICLDILPSHVYIIELHIALFCTHFQYQSLFLTYLSEQIVSAKQSTLVFPPLTVRLSPITLFLIFSFQYYISKYQENGYLKVLGFYQHFITQVVQMLISSEKDKNQPYYTFLQTHHTDLCSIIQHPLLPICSVLLVSFHSVLQSQLSSFQIQKLTFSLYSSFIITMLNLKRRYDEGTCIINTIEVTKDKIDDYVKDWQDDCCIYCGTHIQITESCCKTCLTKDQVHKAVYTSIEKYKQHLINFLSIASYASNGYLWKACRDTYFAIWKIENQSLAHDSKLRKKSTYFESQSTLPDLNSLALIQAPPSYTVHMLTRSLLMHSSAICSVTSLLSSILSSIQSSTIRSQLLGLSTLYSILSNTPSLIEQPSILHTLTLSISSSSSSVVERIIDILILQPSLIVNHSLLYRTAISLALHFDTKTLHCKSYQLIAACNGFLIKQAPIDYAIIKQFVQYTMKYLINETNPICIKYGEQAIQVLWSLPSLTMLHQQLVIPFQDNRHSLVPQDSALYIILIDILRKEPVISLIPSYFESCFAQYTQTKDEKELKMMCFYLSILSQTPKPICNYMTILMQDMKIIQPSSTIVWILKVIIKLLKTDKVSKDELEHYQCYLIDQLPQMDTVEGIKYCIKCIMKLVILLHTTKPISSLLKASITILKDNQEKSANQPILLRSIIIIGHIYHRLTRSLYIQLIHTDKEQPSILRYEQVATLLETLFTNPQASHMVIYYSLMAYFQCLLHNPGTVSPTALNYVIDMIKTDCTELKIIALRCIYEYIKQLPTILISSEDIFPQIQTPTSIQEEDKPCEVYDWLPSIIRAISPSIKDCCYSTNQVVITYALSFLYLVIQQGLVYGVDCIEPVILHITSSHRTIRKLAEKVIEVILTRCSGIVATRLALGMHHHLITNDSNIKYQQLALIIRLFYSISEKETVHLLQLLINIGFDETKTTVESVIEMVQLLISRFLTSLCILSDDQLTESYFKEHLQETTIMNCIHSCTKVCLLRILHDYLTQNLKNGLTKPNEHIVIPDCLKVSESPLNPFDVVTLYRNANIQSETKSILKQKTKKSVKRDHNEDSDYIEYNVC